MLSVLSDEPVSVCFFSTSMPLAVFTESTYWMIAVILAEQMAYFVVSSIRDISISPLVSNESASCSGHGVKRASDG